MTGRRYLNVGVTREVVGVVATQLRESTRAVRSPWLILVAALVLPPLLHLVGADLAVLALAWLGLAGLLSSGRTLLDRLFLAGTLLAGLLLAGGWLFSLWPWGLAPAPVGMVLLGGIAAFALLGRRRFTLPRRVEASDAVILAAGAVAMWLVLRPLRGVDLLHRLPYETPVLDRMAHFALFDAIQNVGGYTFLHQAAARHYVQTPTEVVYPQGSHFLLALVNNLLSSTTHSPVGLALLNRYVLLVLVVYAAGVAGVAWAARWVAGPAASEPLRCAVAGGAALFVLLGPTAGALIGADSQLFGMVMLALACVLAVRPLASYVEHLLLFGAVTVAVFYAYNPFGPFVLLAFAFSALAYRLPVFRRWRVTLAIAGPALVIALIPSYLSATDTNFNAKQQALVEGTHLPMSSALLPFVGVLVVAPVLVRRARAQRQWRGVAAVLGSVILVEAVFNGYSAAQGGGSYYGGKLNAGAYIVLVAMLGTLGWLAPRRTPNPALDPSEPQPARHRHGFGPPRWALSLAVVAALVLVAGAFVQQQLPGTTTGRKQGNAVPLRQWTDGEIKAGNGALEMYLAEAGLTPSPRVTILVNAPFRSQAWGMTFYLSALSGRLGAMVTPLRWLGKATPTAAQLAYGVGHYQQLTALVRLAAQTAPSPPLIVVYDAGLAADISAALAKAPAVPATVRLDLKMAAAARATG